MILPVANLLIYAHDSRAPEHAKTKKWRETALSSREPVGVPWGVVLAFSRIMTHPQICENPLSIPEVREIVDDWLDAPCLRLIQLSDQALPRFFDLPEDAQMGDNLCTRSTHRAPRPRALGNNLQQ